VIDAIPRLLPDALRRLVRNYHPDEYDYLVGDHAPTSRNIDNTPAALQHTLHSFSFQWNTFSEMFPHWEEDFLDYVTPLKATDFAGKLGLDAGCGFGRHLYHAAKFGAEMVGLDLSEAVVAAHRNTRGVGQVHIVQGDLFQPPLRPDTFDFAYSIGVLHHTPAPPKAFASVAALVRPGGTMSAWIYGPRQGPSEWITVGLRTITTRMNYRLLYMLCLAIAVGLRIASHYPYRILNQLGLRRLAELLPLNSHHRYPFRVVVADAFDRLSVPLVTYHSGEDLAKWFHASAYVDVNISRRFRNNESWRGFGHRA
jgi:SAM-dependent methyltransferase